MAAKAEGYLNQIGDLHGINLEQQLPAALPYLQAAPDQLVHAIPRFKSYFTLDKSSNWPYCLRILTVLASQVPACRQSIRESLAEELQDLLAHPTYQGLTVQLLKVLELPLDDRDAELRQIAREIHVLKQKPIVIIGAGFSYDTMPLGRELLPVLRQVLAAMGKTNVSSLLDGDWGGAWEAVKADPSRFQMAFLGYCANKQPTEQHAWAARMLKDRSVVGALSFNWDDLIERQDTSVSVIKRDGQKVAGPGLWKMHGCVTNPTEPWIYPPDKGRVFAPVMEYLEGQVAKHSIGRAIVIGYSEREPVVRKIVFGFLERNKIPITRVGPGLEPGPQRVRLTARRFAIALDQYVRLVDSGVVAPST